MILLGNAESAIKYFRSFVEAVGDQELKSSFIFYMSPIRHTLAFDLSKSLYVFNSV